MNHRTVCESETRSEVGSNFRFWLVPTETQPSVFHESERVNTEQQALKVNRTNDSRLFFHQENKIENSTSLRDKRQLMFLTNKNTNNK